MKRAVVMGAPEEARPFVELRDTRKLSDADKRAAAEADELRRR